MPDTSPDIHIVVARAANGVIGNNGGLPWHLPADLKKFRAITMSKPLLMGRLTHASIGRALPGRRNLVLSKDQKANLAPGCELVRSIEHALELTAGLPEIMVIGGAGVYRQCLPMAQRIYMTEVMADCQGELFFPTINPEPWQEIERQQYPADENNEYPMQFITLIRRC